jgi:hypothetical protein
LWRLFVVVVTVNDCDVLAVLVSILAGINERESYDETNPIILVLEIDSRLQSRRRISSTTVRCRGSIPVPRSSSSSEEIINLGNNLFVAICCFELCFQTR